LVRADADDSPVISTMMRSAAITVLMRWATMKTVASAVSCFNAARSLASVAKSSAEKVSSNT